MTRVSTRRGRSRRTEAGAPPAALQKMLRGEQLWVAQAEMKPGAGRGGKAWRAGVAFQGRHESRGDPPHAHPSTAAVAAPDNRATDEAPRRPAEAEGDHRCQMISEGSTMGPSQSAGVLTGLIPDPLCGDPV